MALWRKDRPSGSRLLRFEMPLNQLAQHGGEMHLAQPRANLQLNGIADAEPVRGFHICAAEANGLYPGHAYLGTGDLGAQRRVERNTRVAARYHKIAESRAGGFESGAKPGRAGTFLQ